MGLMGPETTPPASTSSVPLAPRREAVVGGTAIVTLVVPLEIVIVVMTIILLCSSVGTANAPAEIR
jgi:hypothetical protein